MTVVINFAKFHAAFAANDETIKITQTGFAVSNDATPALTSAGFSNLTLHNYGWISNNGGTGLLFTKTSTGDITNHTSGKIVGTTGVLLNSSDTNLENHGMIYGFGAKDGDAGVSLGAAGYLPFIENYGGIQGKRAGIECHSAPLYSFGPCVVIDNYDKATIKGGEFGINFAVSSGVPLFVHNDGIIQGGTASIATSQAGSIELQNDGTLIGKISLQSASALDDDRIENNGTIQGTVLLGRGKDSFYGEGTSGAVFGQGGDDTLIGTAGVNKFYGGVGNDLLSGHGGNDTLVGGAGKDTFAFGSVLAGGVARITDFAHGIDTIALNPYSFTGVGTWGDVPAPGRFFIGPAAHDSDDRVIYNPANGWLIYDSNGNASGGAHHFATLASNLTLTNADFLLLAYM